MRNGATPKLAMVVDDDDDVRITMTEILEIKGYAAIAAHNGQHALEQLHNGIRPGVILLDLMMPTMNGYEFRAKQLEDPLIADIPIIVFSAGRELDAAARELKAAGVLRKPITLEELTSAIEKAYSGRSESGAR